MERDRGQDDGIDRLIRAALKGSGAHGTGVCPDANLLAAFADGGLSADERAAVEPHLAACARCQTVLAMAASDADDAARVGLAEPSAVPAPAPSHPRPDSPRAGWLDVFSWRWLAPAAGVAALGLILYVAVRPPVPSPSTESSTAAAPELTMASKGEREGVGQGGERGMPAKSRGRLDEMAPDARVGQAATAPAVRQSAEPGLADRALPAPAEPAPTGVAAKVAEQAPAAPAPATPPPARDVPVAPMPAEAAMDIQVQAPPQMRAEGARARATEVPGASRAEYAAAREAAVVRPKGQATDIDALWADAALVVLARAIDRPASWDQRPDTTAFSVTEVFKTADGEPAPTTLALWWSGQPAGRIAPGTVCVLFLQRTAVFAQPPLWVPADRERGVLRLRDDVLEPWAGGGTALGEPAADLLARLRRKGSGRTTYSNSTR